MIQIQTYSSAQGEQWEGLNLFFDTEKMKDAYKENIFMPLRIF